MTSRRDVARLTEANQKVAAAAQRDLDVIMSKIDLDDPTAALTALKQAVPSLVAKYGDLAAAVAADWYEAIRPQGLARFTVRTEQGYPEEAIASRVGSLGQHLVDGDAAGFAQALATALDKFVKQPSRNTVMRNGQRDPWKPRFARVPKGATTCEFCLMLASRGAVYLTKESAGEMGKFHGNCVIEGSMVSGPRAVAATSRMYEGKIVTLTAGGHDLSVTPNHPILTGRGWVAAEFVNEFDHLFVTQFVGGVVAGGPDVYDGPARVEERFIALAMEGDTTRRRVPGAPKQFHGDGGDSEVDVVTTNHLFGDERNASSLEVDAEANLPFGAGVCAGHRRALSALGGAQDAFRAPGATESGSIGGRSLGLALRWGHLASASLARLAHPASMHPSRVEPPTDNSAGDAQITPEGVLTFPGQVSAREVARSLDAVATSTPVDSVRAGYYVGHVYNLSTAPHWYAAESIVTHNCDCQVVAIGPHDDLPDGYDPDDLYERYLAAKSTH